MIKRVVTSLVVALVCAAAVSWWYEGVTHRYMDESVARITELTEARPELGDDDSSPMRGELFERIREQAPAHIETAAWREFFPRLALFGFVCCLLATSLVSRRSDAGEVSER